MSHLNTSFGDLLRCDVCQEAAYSEGMLSAVDIAWDRGWQIAWESDYDDRDLCPACRRRLRIGPVSWTS